MGIFGLRSTLKGLRPTRFLSFGSNGRNYCGFWQIMTDGHQNGGVKPVAGWPDMKLITFLGTGHRALVSYNFELARGLDRSIDRGLRAREAALPTKFFPVALTRYIKPDALRVLLTRDAKELFWDTGEFGREMRAAAPDTDVTPVFIPDGRTEAELWQIFESVAKAVEPGETVVFDITHAFRSLAFLAFLSIAYLRVAKNVYIRDVYYGALATEAGNAGTLRQPVAGYTTRLAPFLSLLDWTEHVAAFVRFGNAGPMAELALAGADDGEGWLAKALQQVSAALLTSQPRALGKAVEALTRAAAAPASSAARVSSHPFAVVRDRAVAEYLPFAPVAESPGVQMDLRMVSQQRLRRSGRGTSARTLREQCHRHGHGPSGPAL